MTIIRGTHIRSHIGVDPFAQLQGPQFPGAACTETDVEAFFPNQGQSPDAAIRVCRGCPAKAACLEWALTHHEAGVWGGTTAKDRKQLRRKRAA